jgi:hypothetical protein
MSAEKDIDKLKKDLEKSRAEIAALQQKLKSSLAKKNGDERKPDERPKPGA